MLKLSTALFLMVAWSAPTLAFETGSLPLTCKASIEGIQNDKAHITELGQTMNRSRKAKDMAAFCKAARDTVALIKEQNEKLEYCLGELSTSTTVTKEAAMQMRQIGVTYKAMVAAAKDARNDRLHCGLAQE